MKTIITMIALCLLSAATSFAAGGTSVTGTFYLNNTSLTTFDGLLRDKGPWASGGPYSAGDVVQNGGSSYVCIKANIDTAIPTSNWAVLAVQGANGTNGLSPALTAEPAGPNCQYGGAKVTVGAGEPVYVCKGSPGVDGKTVRYGAINPTTEGVDGDFYINTASNKIFGPKTGGAWPAGVSLVGPTGANGPSSANYTLPKAPVLATGQQTTYTEGDDGYWKSGAVASFTRFTDNLVNGVSNGTVTDNLTGLIWLKNANCLATLGGVDKTGGGSLAWADALTWIKNLASGSCGLTDGSTAGQWRLPNINELKSLLDRSAYNPALPASPPFTNVQIDFFKLYWSSSTYSNNPTSAFGVFMDRGADNGDVKANYNYVWPVRAGQ